MWLTMKVTIDVDEEEEEEEEAYLGLDPPKATPTVDLRIRDPDLGDVVVVLVNWITMVDEHKWMPSGLLEGLWLEKMKTLEKIKVSQ
jgi:hypothetical protein